MVQALAIAGKVRTTQAARSGASELRLTLSDMLNTVMAMTCAESILDAGETNRVMREMGAFSKQVHAAIVDPAFIVTVRKKLNLDQRQAAEIFGGGINAFSRYETGKTKPPVA